MKSILLASASLVGFVGAAAANEADIDRGLVTGSATLGYNDVIKDGFYWEGNVGIAFSRQLDNGLTAAASLTLNVADDNLGNEYVSVDGDWDISLTSDTAGLYFGDVDQAAEKLYSGVDGMTADGFAEDNIGDAILRGDVMVGGFDLSLSYNVMAAGGLEGLQVGAAGAFGAANVTFGYQDDAFPEGEIFAIAGDIALAGTTVSLGFAQNDVEKSIGVGVSYPFGAVTLSAYFAMNDVSGDNYGVQADYASGPFTVSAFFDVAGDSDGVFGVEGTFAATEAIDIKFGLLNSGDAMYVAAVMDLGSDSSLLVAFADDGNDAFDNDAIGDPEYMEGMTAELSLSF